MTSPPYSNSNKYDFDASSALNGTLTNVTSVSGATSYPSGGTYGNTGNEGQINNVTGVYTSCIYQTTSLSEVTFDLASLSNTSGNEADGSDEVLVEISINGGTSYSTIITINGNSNASWAYSATGTAFTAYSNPLTFAPAGGGVRGTDGFSKVRIVNIPSGDISVRISATNNSPDEYWAIDNIVLGSNSTLTSKAISTTSASISQTSNTNLLSWSNPNCFTNIVVIAKAGSAPTFDPSSGNCNGSSGDCISSDFNSSSIYGNGSSGTNLPSGEYCVYNGTGNSVTVSGLTNGTTYHYEVFTYLNPWSTKSASPNLSISQLPVELISFVAKRDQAKTNLSWKTASELNNSHFEIERSTNSVDFETIGSVPGNGTTNELNSYTFQDQNSISTSYYRLKQVDFDGVFEYSKVTKVNSHEKSPIFRYETGIIVSPDEELSYYITSSAGAILLSGEIYSSIIIQERDYPPGIYYVIANERGKLHTYRWVISEK